MQYCINFNGIVVCSLVVWTLNLDCDCTQLKIFCWQYFLVLTHLFLAGTDLLGWRGWPLWASEDVWLIGLGFGHVLCGYCTGPLHCLPWTSLRPTRKGTQLYHLLCCFQCLDGLCFNHCLSVQGRVANLYLERSIALKIRDDYSIILCHVCIGIGPQRTSMTIF